MYTPARFTLIDHQIMSLDATLYLQIKINLIPSMKALTKHTFTANFRELGVFSVCINILN